MLPCVLKLQGVPRICLASVRWECPQLSSPLLAVALPNTHVIRSPSILHWCTSSKALTMPLTGDLSQASNPKDPLLPILYPNCTDASITLTPLAGASSALPVYSICSATTCSAVTICRAFPCASHRGLTYHRTQRVCLHGPLLKLPP